MDPVQIVYQFIFSSFTFFNQNTLIALEPFTTVGVLSSTVGNNLLEQFNLHI